MDAVTQSSPTKEDYLPVCTAKYLGSSDEEEYNLGPAKDSSGEEVLPQPTEEEEKELRRIVAYPPWYIYLLCFIEFAERASYYGTGDRLNNFYQNPLPPNGNGAGAPAPGSLDSPGGLGKGLQVANSLYQLLRFTSYFFPLITGYVSDVYLGPMQMLWTGVWTGIFSHVVFVLAALPPVLKHTNASMVISLIGLLSLSVCTAFVKPVLLPLLLHQYPHKYNVVKTLKTGERVILDRDASLQRMTMSFYWAINVGAFVSVGTSYSAKDIGYWLAFLIPLVIYLMMPPVLLFLQHRMVVQPPSGNSVFSDVLKVIKVCFEAGWIKRYRQGTFWEYAKPTNLRLQGRVGWRKKKPGFYKEGMVSDTKLVLSACTIFLYYIIYNMNDSQLNPAINNQTISMTAKGVPNDVIGNFNALSIIIFMPLLDYGVYPLLRRTRITFKPVHRIFVGFMVGVASSVAGAVIQWRIYETSPCGNHASDCVKNGGGVSPLSLWLVGIEYVLQGVSECLAMTTGYEIAFERSPKEMKSFVMALFLSTIAASAILAEVINPIMSDPYLIVPFAMFAALGTLFALLFLYRYRNLDDEMEAEKLQRQLPELIERTSH